MKKHVLIFALFLLLIQSRLVISQLCSTYDCEHVTGIYCWPDGLGCCYSIGGCNDCYYWEDCYQICELYGCGTSPPNPYFNYSLNSTSSTTAGGDIQHRLYWSDNVDMSGYMFQFCNGTWNGTMCLGICPLQVTTILNESNGGNVGDSYVDQSSGNSNYGTATSLYVLAIFGSIMNERTFTLWNLSAIPTGSKITNANLSLYMYSALGSSETYNAYNTTNSWTQTGITWNNAPNYTTGVLQQGILTGTTANVWLYWNVTNAAVSQFAQANQNMSILIRDSSEGNSGGYQGIFYSKEYGTATNRPQLAITYTTSGTTIGNCGWVTDAWTNNSNQFTGTSAWSNVTKKVNSTVGATIAWCVYANDTAGSWNGTSCSNPFTYNTTGVMPPSDTTPPTYSFDSDDSGGYINKGTVVNISTLWYDSGGIASVNFVHNETGSWVVDSCALTNPQWCNFTIDTAGYDGKTICWYQNATDVSGNSVSMEDEMRCFSVTSSVSVSPESSQPESPLESIRKSISSSISEFSMKFITLAFQFFGIVILVILLIVVIEELVKSH